MRIRRALALLLALPVLMLTLRTAPAETKPVDPAAYPDGVRVACVGDSITFGSGIRDRATKSYPAQLQALLGDRWQVKNFGVSGATMLKKGDKPYWRLKAFTDAKAFAPHVVIIKLGTNDTKPQNWQHGAEFKADYLAMIAAFRALEKKPRIYVCRPVPVYQAKWGINEPTVKNEVIPQVNAIAAETGATLIDLHTALSGKGAMFPDKIHPNAAGAALMAKTIRGVLTGK